MEDSENISYGFSPKSSFSKNQITSFKLAVTVLTPNSVAILLTLTKEVEILLCNFELSEEPSGRRSWWFGEAAPTVIPEWYHHQSECRVRSVNVIENDRPCSTSNGHASRETRALHTGKPYLYPTYLPGMAGRRPTAHDRRQRKVCIDVNPVRLTSSTNAPLVSNLAKGMAVDGADGVHAASERRSPPQ
ncbi:hypothetical protein GEV33_011651 [Tenebrio molitor]|uniref:Uncharacterized protein n=1 Tax=Tenebrio molitor TaxID=7067 RepID=A0A8J6HCE0_TENMO|nr:hypothetical protein GEV33_011651 [Tenebrio molitor]